MEEKIEEVHEHHSKKNKSSEITEKMRKNPWILSTIVLGILVLIFLVGSVSMTGKVISEKEAGDSLVAYLSSVGYDGFEVSSVEELETMYMINTIYNEEEIPFYVTKDGYIVGNSLISLVQEEKESSSGFGSTEIPKTDKPVVELFVMSYCPYGTQAEKGILPVAELLGEAIDFRIRFVDYVMHGEKESTENLREYCIQEIASEKYLDYMYCFLEGDGDDSSGYITNGNDVDTCLAKAGIDSIELATCMTEKDEEFGISKALSGGATYPSFDVDSDLNDEYGVSGSPTLVINGEIVSSTRDSASYLNAICSAFNDAPEECGEELSSESPSVYFGWDGTSSGSASNVCG